MGENSNLGAHRRSADRVLGPRAPEPVPVSAHSGDAPLRWSQEDIDADMFRDCEEDDDFFDCHMGPDGYCGAAGSEDCEFECPYRRRQRGYP